MTADLNRAAAPAGSIGNIFPGSVNQAGALRV
jgi:hypothetical protein